MKNGCRTQSLFDRVRTSASAYGALCKSHDVVNEERKTERRVSSNNRAVLPDKRGEFSGLGHRLAARLPMRDRHLRCVYNLEGLGNPSSC